MALDANMVTALTSGTGYFITLIEIIARAEEGGDAIRLAVHTRDYAFAGHTFKAFPFQTSKFQMKSGVEPDNATIRHILEGTFSRINIAGGKWSGARINVYVVDFLHPEWGFARRHTGRLGEVTTGGLTAETEFRGTMQLLNQEIGDKTSAWCRYDLGDEFCTLDLTPFTFPGTVTTLTSQQVMTIGLDMTNKNGLLASYYSGQNFEAFGESRVEGVIDANYTNGRPLRSVGPSNFSVRWDGKIEPEFTESYTFKAIHNDGMKVWVNGTLIIDQWGTTGTHTSAPIALTAGTKYTIKVEYFQWNLDGLATLKWSSASQPEEVIPSDRYYNESFVVPDGYFEKGKIIWTSGNNVGLKMEVAQNVGEEITLFLPMRGEVEIGDDFEIIAGDIKDLETCWQKFDNAINFGGEHGIPKPEDIYHVPE